MKKFKEKRLKKVRENPFKVSRKDYFPIEFQLPNSTEKLYCLELKYKKIGDAFEVESVSGAPLVIADNTVIEFSYSYDKKAWTPVRNRPEKTAQAQKELRFGNDWQIAVDTWELIENPITVDMITGKEPFPEKYFQSKSYAQNYIETMLMFHNFSKNKLYARFADTPNLLEIAGGRANDLHKWINNRIKNVTLVELDADAIKEGQERISEVTGGNVPKVKMIQADASKDIVPILTKEKVKKNSFELVVCNFAIHYFLGSEGIFDQFYQNVTNYIKPGGHFVATGFNGEMVFKFLVENNIQYLQSYDFTKKIPETDSMLKVFSITRLFSEDKLLNTGQEINVFIGSGINAKENLINFQYMIEKFTANKEYKVVEFQPFSKFYEEFTEKKRKRMSDIEEKFSKLNYYIIFQKL